MRSATAVLPRLALFGIFTSILFAPLALARRDLPASDTVPQAEIVVFEIEGCPYCELFRRDVWPGYRRSPRHAQMPLRFVDVRRTDLAGWRLVGPVRVVPTVVLLKGGREIGRLTGYTGPEAFFQQVRHMLMATDE